MADYNRFVSYVYVYENNQKTLNNGFVRVETLDGRCKVYIHMKDLYGSPQTDFMVYMVRRQGGKMQGINLGVMNRDGSQGEFFHETQKDDIENSGISLNEVAGIVIIGSRGQKYGTCWDDDMLDMYRFEVYETSVQKNTEETADLQQPKFITMPASEMEIVAVESKSENADIYPDTGSEEKNVDSEKLLEPPGEPGESSILDAQDTEYMTSAASVTLSEAALTAAPLMGTTAGKKLSLEEKLEKILAQGIKMYPFEDDKVVACIRFELQDIGMMPMKFWSYVSNSFLLHNYYSYRHLIFGKFGDGRYFLGVPGMGQQKDRFMAQLFGFTAFKAIRESENGQSDFGYWYVVLN